MKIIKAEIIKHRPAHRKTVYRVALVQQIGFWFFKTQARCALNWPFNSYEQAHRWVRQNYPDVKTITPGHAE